MKLKIAALGAKGIPHPGGIELVMEEIGSRLVQRGHKFDIFVREHYMADKPFLMYKEIGLPRSFGFHSKYLDALSHSISAFPQIIKNKYNIIYINSMGLSILSWLPLLLGKKVVVHTHGLDWKREKWGFLAKKLIRVSAWTAANLTHYTFCVCLQDKRFLENHYGKSCHYIPNGIPNAIYRGPNKIKRWGLKGGDYLLFMARLVPEKGAHFLLQAWRNIPNEVKQNKKLVIAGDSNHRDKYYYDLMNFQNSQNIIFTGFVTGLLKEELLSNTLCFIQPSTIEGMSLSTLEAMGYGRMILTSDIQENLDMLSGHGWTFQSQDVDDLSSKLKKILTLESDKIKNEGKKIHKFGVENYNWERVTDRVEKHLINLFSS